MYVHNAYIIYVWKSTKIFPPYLLVYLYMLCKISEIAYYKQNIRFLNLAKKWHYYNEYIQKNEHTVHDFINNHQNKTFNKSCTFITCKFHEFAVTYTL